MPVYQPGIPTGTVNLDVDYQNIQDNFSQLDICFNVDHVTFSNTTAQTGYHKSIHFNPESTTAIPAYAPNNYVTATQYPQGVPATVAGIGQLFSSSVNDAISVDTGLYWKSGNGLSVAMTRNFSPVRAANGYTFLPGGLILQWGTIAGFNNTRPPALIGPNKVTFPLTFPNAVFSITLGPVRPDDSNQVLSIYNANTTTAAFYLVTGSNSYTSTYWQAIGY